MKKIKTNPRDSCRLCLRNDLFGLTLLAPDRATPRVLAARFYKFKPAPSRVRAKNAPPVKLSLGRLFWRQRGKRMMRRKISPRYSIIMATIAFIVAALPAFGMVMKEDPVGQTIFVAVWVLIGLAWLGHFVRVKKSASKK